MKKIDKLSEKAKLYLKKPIPLLCEQMNEPFFIHTPTGTVRGVAGDYIIQNTSGVIYICKKEWFEKSYDIYKEEN